MASKKKKKVAKKVVKKAVKKSTSKIASKKSTKKLTKKAVKKPAPKKVSQPAKKPVPVDYSKAITPLGNRLVVKVLETEKKTPGGLIIPDSVSQVTGYLQAKVLAVGIGAKNKKGIVKPMDVQIGDTVLFSQYSGTKVEFKSEEVHIIQEVDVMGVVQDSFTKG